MTSSVPLLATLPVGFADLVRTYEVDQALIDRYAAVSGDHNPLHTDPDFAATTIFGRTIAHGMMTLAFVSSAMTEWAGLVWAQNGTLDVAFLSPVYPGDTLTVSAEILSQNDGRCVCGIVCQSGERTIARGETSVSFEEAVNG